MRKKKLLQIEECRFLDHYPFRQGSLKLFHSAVVALQSVLIFLQDQKFARLNNHDSK
jgi:hypothetical protein